MIILGIETSGRTGGVALCDDRRELAAHAFAEAHRRARNIMVAIDDVVRRAGMERRDIGAVSVSQGPGSFTGLRVGITCAKVLAYALGVPVVGVPSLAVQAENVDPAEHGGCRAACPVQDARRARVYGDLFEWDGRRWTDTTGVLLKGPRELADLLPAGALVFGTGVRAYPDVFTAERFRLGLEELADGRAEVVARLGLALLHAGRAVDPARLVPCYYRLTEPEEKLATSAGRQGKD